MRSGWTVLHEIHIYDAHPEKKRGSTSFTNASSLWMMKLVSQDDQDTMCDSPILPVLSRMRARLLGNELLVVEVEVLLTDGCSYPTFIIFVACSCGKVIAGVLPIWDAPTFAVLVFTMYKRLGEDWKLLESPPPRRVSQAPVSPTSSFVSFWNWFMASCCDGC